MIMRTIALLAVFAAFTISAVKADETINQNTITSDESSEVVGDETFADMSDEDVIGALTLNQGDTIVDESADEITAERRRPVRPGPHYRPHPVRPAPHFRPHPRHPRHPHHPRPIIVRPWHPVYSPVYECFARNPRGITWGARAGRVIVAERRALRQCNRHSAAACHLTGCRRIR